MRVSLTLATAVLLATPAYAQPSPTPSERPASQVITNPDWLAQPGRDEITRSLPMIAMMYGWSGAATLRCVATAQGLLTDCHVRDERPQDADFGEAALRLAPLFRLRTPQADGTAVDGRPVDVNIRWANSSATGSRNPTAAEVEAARREIANSTQITRQEATVAQPRWLAAPTRAQVAAAVPGAEGVVTMLCHVEASGVLNDCDVTKRRPESLAAGRVTTLGSLFRLDMEGAPEGVSLSVEVLVAVSAPPEYVARPRFAAVPTGAEIETALRGIASAQADHTARAALDCRTGEAGVLTDCRVTSATPEAAGPALLGLAPRFAVRPWTEDGYPTAGARVRLPLRYVAD